MYIDNNDPTKVFASQLGTQVVNVIQQGFTEEKQANKGKIMQKETAYYQRSLKQTILIKLELRARETISQKFHPKNLTA